MATHSSVLAWRIPGTGEPGGLPSTGSHRVGHNWSNSSSSNICIIRKVKWDYMGEQRRGMAQGICPEGVLLKQPQGKWGRGALIFLSIRKSTLMFCFSFCLISANIGTKKIIWGKGLSLTKRNKVATYWPTVNTSVSTLFLRPNQ